MLTVNLATPNESTAVIEILVQAVYRGERPDDAGYIHNLAITRAATGQHVGVQLLDWSERLISERGRPYARLDCHAANPTINRFYQSTGCELRGSVDVN